MANALKKFGEAALKPVFKDGFWRKPKVSARIAADLKKEALFAGRQAHLSHAYFLQLALSLSCLCARKHSKPACEKSHMMTMHREWPFPEKVSKQYRPFGQYKAPKGHKYEKKLAER